MGSRVRRTPTRRKGGCRNALVFLAIGFASFTVVIVLGTLWMVRNG